MDAEYTAAARPRLTLVPPQAPTRANPSRPAPTGPPPLVVHAIAARSAYLRVAPVIAELERRGELRQAVVDLCPPDSRPTDAELEEIGFPLGAPSLAPGAGPHGERLARMLAGFEQILLREPPAVVMLSGGRNAALACALAAAKLRIPIARLDAGLRSFDWGSGEEIDRVLVDRLSDVLFTQSPEAHDNLRREGITDGRTHYVGNPVVDCLQRRVPGVQPCVRSALGLEQHDYVLVALSRRATVDGPGRAGLLVDGLLRLAACAPVALTLSPRTAPALAAAGLAAGARRTGVHTVGALGPLEFLALAASAGAVVTDSGSVQEEASALGIPCFTMRSTTERPVTLIHGTNTLLGDDPADLAAVADARRPPGPSGIPLWDGRSSARIADVLVANFALRGRAGTGC